MRREAAAPPPERTRPERGQQPAEGPDPSRAGRSGKALRPYGIRINRAEIPNSGGRLPPAVPSEAFRPSALRHSRCIVGLFAFVDQTWYRARPWSAGSVGGGP